MQQITDVIVTCTFCSWRGTVGDCDCDGDHPDLVDCDDGRLRCPKCIHVAREVEFIKENHDANPKDVQK